MRLSINMDIPKFSGIIGCLKPASNVDCYKLVFDGYI